MPFETFANPSRRIAVTGGGIAGQSAAHFLTADNAVVLAEAESRLGGHARSVFAGRRGDQPVDTGFIVYNRVNYPHLRKLFEKLDVPVTPSNMSFGAFVAEGWLEHALASLGPRFARKHNLRSPGFLRMCRDILHFDKHAAAIVRPDMTIRALLEQLGTGRYFGE